MKLSLRVLAACAALVGTVSCSAETKSADTARDTSVAGATPSTSTPSPTPAEPPSADQSMGSWKVTEFGIGPLRAGMTMREAVATLKGAGINASEDSSKDCHYLTWSGPTAVGVMLEQGVVGRVEVGNRDIATKEGAKIGDAESRVQSLYPNRVTVQPHKYVTGGHYLVVKPVAPADSAYRIVFETDGKSVTKYRSGKEPQVGYVEGCG
ncbi:MAG: hypothetical protein ABIT20_12545 [Gemmatimonadaceae bacterium]